MKLRVSDREREREREGSVEPRVSPQPSEVHLRSSRSWVSTLQEARALYSLAVFCFSIKVIFSLLLFLSDPFAVSGL